MNFIKKLIHWKPKPKNQIPLIQSIPLIPFYLQYKIIKFIINYLLIKNNSKFNKININTYSKQRFYYNFNEVINYLYVSKRWFNKIQYIISNKIIKQDQSIEYWFKNEYCYRFNYKRNGDIGINQFNLNNNYNINTNYIYFKHNEPKYYNGEKLVKLKVNESIWSIINIDKELILNYQTKQVIFFRHQIMNSNLSVSNFFNELNSKFNNPQLKRLILDYKISDYNSIHDIITLPYELPSFLECKVYTKNLIGMPNSVPFADIQPTNNNKIIPKKVNKLEAISFGYPSTNYLKYFKPIKLDIIDKINKYHGERIPQPFINEFFDYFSDTLQHLKLVYEFYILEPFQLLDLNLKLPKLNTLAISLYFHFLTKCFNTCSNENKDKYTLYNGFNCANPNVFYLKDYPLNYNPETNEKYWNQLIEQLIENKTITNLEFHDSFECNRKYTCFQKSDIISPIISNGLKNLFQFNKTIKYLKLIELDILDEISLSGLLNNTTIKVLVISFKDVKNNQLDNHYNDLLTWIEYLFSTILNNDNLNSFSSIKQLKIITQRYSENYEGEDYQHYKLKYKGLNYYTKFISFILKMIIKYPNSKLYSIQLPFILYPNSRGIFELFCDRKTHNQINIKEFIFIPYFYSWNHKSEEYFLDLQIFKSIIIQVNNINNNENNRKIITFKNSKKKEK